VSQVSDHFIKNHTAVRKQKKESLLESITDSILNARGKVKKHDERFTEVNDTVTKTEQSLHALEKLFAGLTKRQTGIACLVRHLQAISYILLRAISEL
jgi:S-ribosylhomocysteine lyase LuxS involved in autoinducer biosynthesis